MGQAAIGPIFQGVGAIQQGKAQHASIEAADSASRIAYGDAETYAQQLELQAKQQEADRKEALLKALSSQNVMAGAQGSIGGSPFAVMEADIRSGEENERRAKMMSDLEIRALRYNAMAQRKTDRINKRIQGFSAFHNTISQVGGAAGGAASGME